LRRRDLQSAVPSRRWDWAWLYLGITSSLSPGRGADAGESCTQRRRKRACSGSAKAHAGPNRARSRRVTSEREAKQFERARSESSRIVCSTTRPRNADLLVCWRVAWGCSCDCRGWQDGRTRPPCGIRNSVQGREARCLTLSTSPACGCACMSSVVSCDTSVPLQRTVSHTLETADTARDANEAREF
jgi:hypothetical protein